MPELFNVHGFGPSAPFTEHAACPWVDHVVSGLTPTTLRHLKARFHYGSASETLSLAVNNNSPVHYAKGTQSPIPLAGHRAPTAL